jgi:hypothetical protein
MHADKRDFVDFRLRLSRTIVMKLSRFANAILRERYVNDIETGEFEIGDDCLFG